MPDDPRLSEQAISVDTYVVPHRGQWQVDIVVIFPDEIVCRTVSHYRTERLARIAASLIKRAAERDTRGPVHG